MCEQLDNKHDFCQLAKQLGLTSPTSFHVTDEATARQLNNDLQSAGHSPMTPHGTQFILKNLQYDPVHRLDMFKLPCETSKLDAYYLPVTAASRWHSNHPRATLATPAVHPRYWLAH